MEKTTPEKPGWKTTEFWVTLLSQLLVMLTIIGAITAEQQVTLAKAIQLVGQAVALAFAAFGYNVSRGLTKQGLAKKE